MNWSKFIVEHGQACAWIATLLSLLVVILAFRKGRYFLPRGPLGWIASFLALIVIYFSVGFLRWAQAKINPLKPVFHQADRQAPEFAFQSVDDNSLHSLSEFHGKVVVLNIWATWCLPCREEMPSLDRLQQEYGKDGLVVIAVSDETKERIEKFPGYSQLHLVRGRVEENLPAAGLYIKPDVARPVTHIIDRDGVLRKTLIGGQNYSSFEKNVLPYLKSHG
jgi:thiol-disulfide isomerase/thioredoxin